MYELGVCVFRQMLLLEGTSRNPQNSEARSELHLCLEQLPRCNVPTASLGEGFLQKMQHLRKRGSGGQLTCIALVSCRAISLTETLAK